MEQLLEFLGNHPLLTAAFFGVQGMLVWTFIGGARGVERLSPVDATRLINDEDAVVLDVRSDGEFNQGHILNAVHVPQAQIANQAQRLEKYRDRPIIATCRTGQTSLSAGAALRKQGFERVYSLNGGIAAWEGASLPLTRK